LSVDHYAWLAAHDSPLVGRYDAAVTQRQSLFILLAQTAVAMCVLVAATVLGAMDKIDGSAVTAIFGAAIGLVGPATVTLGGSMLVGGPRPDYKQLANASPEAAAALAGSHAPPAPEAPKK
jgi:hypothetical protein